MTTAPVTTTLERYAVDYRAFTTSLDGGQPSWLAGLRARAWQEFSNLGFPTARRGNELWKYTDLRPVDRAEFRFDLAASAQEPSLDDLKKAAPWSDAWHTAVLVDGVFNPALSNNLAGGGLTVTSLEEAISDQRELVEPHLATIAEFQDRPFIALNTAFIKSGVFVHIAPGAELESPVHLLNVTSAGASGRAIYPRLLIIAGENSHITLIETHISLSDGQQLVVPVVEASLASGSRVRHFRVQLENEKTFHIATTRVRQSDNAAFDSTSFATGPAIGRNDVHTFLDEPGANCTLHGLYVTNHRSQQDNEISTTHSKPHGTSHQFYKGILAGKSRAVFSGKVYVAEGAVKTVAQQKDLNLLLSHGAEIDTKPSLEILADDVKCAHGATAGHVDRDMLFYLQSRGIGRETATAMLIAGFGSEIIDEFEPEELRDYLHSRLEEIIPQLESEGIL